MEDTLRKKAIREIAARNEENEKVMRSQNLALQRLSLRKSGMANCWNAITTFFGRSINKMIDKDGLELKWFLSEDYYILLFVDSVTQVDGREPLAKITVGLDSNDNVFYGFNDWMYYRKETYTPSYAEACNFIAEVAVRNLCDESLHSIIDREE